METYSADALPAGLEPGEVRVDDVHTELAVGEHHPAVDDDDVALVLEREAIHADLAETAEGDDVQGVAHYAGFIRENGGRAQPPGGAGISTRSPLRRTRRDSRGCPTGRHSPRIVPHDHPVRSEAAEPATVRRCRTATTALATTASRSRPPSPPVTLPRAAERLGSRGRRDGAGCRLSIWLRRLPCNR